MLSLFAFLSAFSTGAYLAKSFTDAQHTASWEMNSLIELAQCPGLAQHLEI